MSDENLAENRDEKAKKIQHPKGKLSAYERIDLLLDEGSFTEIDDCLLYTSPSPRDRG